MKVLLVNPPQTLKETEKGSTASKLLQRYLGFYPPIGLIHLSAYLEERGHKVDVLDAAALGLANDAIAEKVKVGGYDVVGIGCTTAYWRSSRALAVAIRKSSPDVPLVIGGAHARFYPSESLQYSDFDYAVFGEGEVTFTELLDALAKSGDVSRVDGLAFKKGKKVTVNPQREWIKDMDALPFASWEKLPLHAYGALLTGGRKNFICMMTSRGCPYQCTFCSDTSRLGRKFRPMSPQRVFSEIEHVYHKNGVRYIAFYDDTFTADMERIGKICDMIIASGMKLKWDCRTRVDRVDEKLLWKMKRAGCVCIKYGVESGIEHIRNDIIKKGVTDAQVMKAIELTKKVGIDFHAYFMIGNPTETPATVRKTIDFSIKIDPDMAFFQNVVLQDATCPMFRWALENGYVKEDFTLDYIKGKSDVFYQLLVTQDISFSQHQLLAREAVRRFYLRPRFIFKRLMKINSFAMLYDHLLLGAAFILYRLEKT
jgi:anaerobic magnesium-protoporphyrin IX monomethyl ester cyclase